MGRGREAGALIISRIIQEKKGQDRVKTYVFDLVCLATPILKSYLTIPLVFYFCCSFCVDRRNSSGVCKTGGGEGSVEPKGGRGVSQKFRVGTVMAGPRDLLLPCRPFGQGGRTNPGPTPLNFYDFSVQMQTSPSVLPVLSRNKKYQLYWIE